MPFKKQFIANLEDTKGLFSKFHFMKVYSSSKAVKLKYDGALYLILLIIFEHMLIDRHLNGNHSIYCIFNKAQIHKKKKFAQ